MKEASIKTYTDAKGKGEPTYVQKKPMQFLLKRWMPYEECLPKPMSR